MNADKIVLLLIFVLIFLDDNVDEERIIFKLQKFSLRVLLSICLIFCQFQPRIAYKSVAYKKKERKRLWTGVFL